MSSDLGYIPLDPTVKQSFNLSAIKRSNEPKPPKIVIYGTPGIGKTTFGAHAPSPIVIQTEEGLGLLDVPHFPVARSYQDVVDAITALLTEKHEFGTVIIDSLDQLEPLIWQHVARRENKPNIEAFGYGKGYMFAAEEMRSFLAGLDALREQGMTVIVIAHSEVKRFESPEHEPFDRYQMRLDKRANDIVCEWADCLLFASYKVHVVRDNVKGQERTRGAGRGERVIHTEERPAWRAKNRYQLPAELPLSWADFEDAIGASFTNQTKED